MNAIAPLHQKPHLTDEEKEDPDAAMPTFGTVGLEHAQSKGEVTASDMVALLDYLETLQK